MAGLATTLGSGAMTNSFDEIKGMDLLFIIGANPTEAHPIVGQKMLAAHKAGALLIVADPRRTALARRANIWLQLKPGTDIALLNGIMKVIVDNNWHDLTFIAKHTENFQAMLPILDQYPLDKVEQITGVPRELIIKAAKKYARIPKAGIFYTLGITQHAHGVNNVLSISNLALLTGHLGKPFMGVNPLRGQNNVQGVCDMGMLPNVYPGYQPVTDPISREKFETAWQRKLPDTVGLQIPAMFDAAIAGKLKTMYIIGENPAVSHANLDWVRSALNSLDFLVVQDIFLTETAKLADVILPAASYAEKDGTFTNSERRIQRVRKWLAPLCNTMPDSDIIIKLSGMMGYPMTYNGPGAVMAEIKDLTPIYGGITYERLDKKGLQWPVLNKEHPGTPYLHDNGKFTRGKGKFIPTEFEFTAEMPCAEYPFIFSTGRIIQHYNTMTADNCAHLTKLKPNDLLMLHPIDGEKLGLESGHTAKISSRRGTVFGKVTVTDMVMPGMAWMSFHFSSELTNNVTSNARDPIAGTYAYKISAVKIERFWEALF